MRRLQTLAILLALSLLLPIAPAHDVITTNLTYTREVARIFLRHCQSCHTASDSIPLTNYQQVRPWATSIKEQVLSRSMPPWGAVKGFGNLDDDLGLNQEELMIIAAWVVGGAPEGNPALLPSPAKSTVATPPGNTLADGPVVNTETRLHTAFRLAGVKPLPETTIESAQLTATLPAGDIVPLVWLYRFVPDPSRSFRLREPIALPPGTRIRSSAPLRFVLQTR